MESLPSCFLLLLLRVMGKNHPVNGGRRAPALTAPWGAMGGTPRLVPLRTTADQVVKAVGVPPAYPPILMANPPHLLLHTWLLPGISTYQLLEHLGRMVRIARGPVG